MPELTIKEIAHAVEGSVTVPKGNPIFSHFHFDTRRITEENSLFFAIKTGANDGHNYLDQLENQKGTGAVVSRDYNKSNLTIPVIRVQDPLQAAQQLASYVRNKYRSCKYIGVTGSAGKTTSKEFIYQVLSHTTRAFRSFQNWNNWIGMPFSLLNMSGEEGAAVFELAMSEPGIGEIDLLARILRPDVAVILNVFPVHLEYLKNLDNVAQAKSEILNHLSSDDAAFINGDSEPLQKRCKDPRFRDLYRKGRKIFFGWGEHNDIRLKEISRLSGSGPEQTAITIDFYGMETAFVTPLVNRVHLENLFIAIMVAQHLGMKNFQIQEAIKNLTPLANRGEITRQGRFTIINETYNSNPEALKKTLVWVDQEFPQKENRLKIAVLGDMLELGEEEQWYHQEVGRFLAGLAFDRLITVGKRALSIAAGAREAGFAGQLIHSCDDAAAAGKLLGQMTAEFESSAQNAEILLLFKASRGIRLENAFKEFLQ